MDAIKRQHAHYKTKMRYHKHTSMHTFTKVMDALLAVKITSLSRSASLPDHHMCLVSTPRLAVIGLERDSLHTPHTYNV